APHGRRGAAVGAALAVGAVEALDGEDDRERLEGRPRRDQAGVLEPIEDQVDAVLDVRADDRRGDEAAAVDRDRRQRAAGAPAAPRREAGVVAGGARRAAAVAAGEDRAPAIAATERAVGRVAGPAGRGVARLAGGVAAGVGL